MTTPQPTPIEDRAAWKLHRLVFDIYRAQGADFKCATEMGFAATDTAAGKPRQPKLCAVCVRRLERKDQQ